MVAMGPPGLLILYGTETGNAQDVAERIGREAAARHFAPRVVPMDGYDIQQMPSEPTVVWVTSTTGQGDPPANMRGLWRFLLRKSLPANSLANMDAAVFGLGDSGYPKYNVTGKKLFRRLEQLGAKMLHELGLGDDQHPSGYEAMLDPWLDTLWGKLREKHPLQPGKQDPAPDAPVPLGDAKFVVEPCGPPAEPAAFVSEHEEAVAAAAAFRRVEAAATGASIGADAEGARHGPWRPFMASVTCNDRITAETHFQETRHIELDLSGSDIEYAPGDLAVLLPAQRAEALDELLTRLHLDGNSWVRVRAAQPTTSCGTQPECVARVRALLAGVIDFASASPRRRAFEVFAAFVPKEQETEHERLTYFGSSEGRDDMYEYNRREGRTLLEVLKDFPHADPPLPYLLEVAPRLKPRQFSIASALAARESPEAHLCVAVATWKTPFKKTRQGLCSTWLKGLAPGARVPVWVEKGALKMPPSHATPMILVGPGTGVAPFRSFLEERHRLRQAGEAEVAPACLVFGCRGKDADYYYASQWGALQAAGTLADGHGLMVAFSRDGPQKRYVTHELRDHAAEVWGMLQQGAYVYVSGSADKMPADVARAFEDIAEAQAPMSREAAQKFIRQMELKGTYHVEAWS